MNSPGKNPNPEVDVRNRIIREKIPVVGIRNTIGKRMKASLESMPQGGVMARYDMSQVVKLKEEMKSRNTRPRDT